MKFIAPLIALGLLACATGEVEEPAPRAVYEEIFVSKNDVNRSAVELELRTIELLPGESPEAALRRVGIEPGSLDDIVEEAGLTERGAPEHEMAHPMDPGADPPAAEPEAPATEPPPPEPEAPATDAPEDPEDPEEPDPPPPEPRAPETAAPPPSGIGAACDVDGTPGVCRRVLDCDERAVPGHCPNAPGAVQCCIPVEQAAPGCTNTCAWANDGACDDGSPGAEFSVCALGTDCNDCSGMAAPPANDPPANDPPANDPPANDPPVNDPPAGGQACVAGGQDGTCGPTAQCDGTPVPGFCPGPADIQCCLPGASVDVDRSPPGVGQACDADGAPGVCQDTSICDGTPVPGHCGGGNNIQCCVPDEDVENKFACAGVCIGVGILVFRGVLYFGTRAIGGAIARQAVVTTVRRTAVNGARTQLNLRATQQALNAATIAAGAADEPEIIEPNLGPGVERFRRSVAGSRDQAPPRAEERTEEDELVCGPGLQACMDRLRDRASGGGGVEGERACSDERAQQLAQQKNARCNDASGAPLSCNRNQDLQSAAQRWIRTGQIDALIRDALIEYCNFNSFKLHNRQQCLRARERVIEECYPGDRGDDGHRCAVCQQLSGVDNCINILNDAFCNDVQAQFSMF